MMRVHLLTFDEFRTPRDLMIRIVDELHGVEDWLAFLPSAIAIISRHTAHELSVALNVRRPGMTFVIAEIDPLRADGQLPKPAWDFVNRVLPRHAGSAGALPPFGMVES